MPLAFLAVFFVYPVVAIVGRGLAPRRSLDLDPLGDVVTDAALRHIAWFTVWQADAVDGPDPRWSGCPARTCSRGASSRAGASCARS